MVKCPSAAAGDQKEVQMLLPPCRCRVNMAQTRPSLPDSGRDFQENVFETVQVVPSSQVASALTDTIGAGVQMMLLNEKVILLPP